MGSKKPAKEDKKSYHHGDLRNALLDAAEAILNAEGVAGLSLRATARRAGVSHMAPYRHFPDKDALLAAVAERGFARLSACGRELPADASPRQRLLEYGIAYVDMLRTAPALADLMFGGIIRDVSDYPTLDREAHSAYRTLDQIIRDCGEAGQLRGSPGPEMTQAAWAFVHGLAVLLTGQWISDRAPVRKIVTLFVDGLTTDSPPTGAGPQLRLPRL